MDKESKLSPAVQPFVPKVQRGFGPCEPSAASSNTLTRQTPYQTEQSSRRNQSGQPSRQRPSTTEGLQGDAHTKHGYSNSRPAKGTTETHTPRERLINDQITVSTSRSDFISQEKSMGRRSLETPKKGFRGTRSALNTTKRSKEVQPDNFEVKMADFPELGVAPWTHAPPAQQKPGICWGSAPPSSIPQSPALTTKTTLARKEPGPIQDVAETGPTLLTVMPGQPAEAGTETSGPRPAVTSWANVASQPPKKPLPKEKTSSSPSSQKEEIAVEQEGEKKKRRRKKKKSKAGGEDVEESEDLLMYQEPPKFEDEEEFPGLALTIAGTPRVQVSTVFPKSILAKPGNEVQENRREGPGLQPGDQNKDKASAGKPLSTETKKGQKSEKTGGKKSKVPVQLDIGNMLAVLEKKQQSQKSKQDAKPVILSVGGALPVGHKNPPVLKKLPWQQDKIAHNPLDSTSPLVKKGKQREVPKAKKPTPLKRVILKEREERKRNRLLEERGLVPQSEAFTPDRNVTEEPCNTVETDQEQQDKISSPTVFVVPEEDQTEDEETREQGEAEEDGEAEPEKDTQEPGETTQAQPCPPNRPKIHSRKFREYCSQVLSKDVDECVTSLLKELVRFQDRLYQKDPMKARMKRRLVMGLREVLKHLKLKKVKCVIISPNCERIQSKGGLDEALHTIIDTCREQGVPFVFALSRKALGRCVNKVVPVSLVGIFNYDGAQDHYHKMIELSSEARRAYEVMIENLERTSQAEQENCEDQPSTEPQLPPHSAQPKEPEYIRLWKNLLEKECNHNVLYNFEEHLSSVSMANDCKEKMEEEERS